MTGSKKDDKGPRAPYEPPRLFDLGGGTAYAAAPGPCVTGGSPTGECNTGSTATGSWCQVGNMAGQHCKKGSTAKIYW